MYIHISWSFVTSGSTGAKHVVCCSICSTEVFKIYIFKNRVSNHNHWSLVYLFENLNIMLELNNNTKDAIYIYIC